MSVIIFSNNILPNGKFNRIEKRYDTIIKMCFYVPFMCTRNNEYYLGTYLTEDDARLAIKNTRRRMRGIFDGEI